MDDDDDGSIEEQREEVVVVVSIANEYIVVELRESGDGNRRRFSSLFIDL